MYRNLEIQVPLVDPFLTTPSLFSLFNLDHTITENQPHNKFKTSVTSQMALTGRISEAFQIRKRKQEGRLQQARTSPEKRNKKARDATVMTGVEAMKACTELVTSDITNYNDPTFSLLMEKATIGIRTIRRATADVDSQKAIVDLVRGGHVWVLLSLLDAPNRYKAIQSTEAIGILQFEAGWCLTNLAATDLVPAIVAQENCFSILGRAITSIHPNVREQTIWCLSNICGFEQGIRRENPYRQEILQQTQIVQGLLDNVNNPANPSILTQSLWAVGNILRVSFDQDVGSTLQQLLGSVLQTLVRLTADNNNISEDDRKEAIKEGFTAITQAIENDPIAATQVSNFEGFIPCAMKVISMYRETIDKTAVGIVCKVVRCLGSLLLYGKNDFKNRLIQYNYLREARRMLDKSNENDYIWNEVCWSFSCVLQAADQADIKAFRQAQCLDALVSVAYISNWRVKERALGALFIFLKNANLIGQRHFFRTHCGMEVLCSSFNSNSIKVMPPSLIHSLLEAVEILLESERLNGEDFGLKDSLWEQKCVETIEQLQLIHDDKTAVKATAIIEKHFMEEDYDDSNGVEPLENEDSFVFGMPTNTNLFRM
jgi:hypothetical protein